MDVCGVWLVCWVLECGWCRCGGYVQVAAGILRPVAVLPGVAGVGSGLFAGARVVPDVVVVAMCEWQLALWALRDGPRPRPGRPEPRRRARPRGVLS